MKNVLSFKKPWIWILIAVVIAAAVAAVCLLTPAPKTEVSAALDECVVSTLRQVHYSSHTEGKYPSVAYTALSVKEKGDTVTVYGVMLYREYTCTAQDELKIWGNAHSPFAVTAKKNADGTYEATDCWWPEDGAEYTRSIKKKFPAHCRKQALNAQRYYSPHDAASAVDARENITAEEKYVVLQSERQNVWLAYCSSNSAAYIVSNAFSSDGTYTAEDGMTTFTFGTCKAAFAVEGNIYVFNEKKSENIPTRWTTVQDVEYLTDGTRFAAQALTDTPTAFVGPTLVVDGGMTWMSDDEIQGMFGYVPDNSHITDPTVSSPSDKPYYLPIRMIKSRALLEQFLNAYKMDDRWRDLKVENFTQFDEAFFEENDLVMTYYKDGTYQAEPSVAAYAITEEGSCLSVRLNVYIPNLHDTALGQWLLFSGIKKSDMENIRVLEAYVQNEFSHDDLVLDETALTFTGKVKQVEEDAILMECYDSTRFSGGVWVELNGSAIEPQAGEEYVVTYEDIVMPSLPPRITAVNITKVES